MKFQAESFELFDKTWALLTAGERERFNPMTISWGGLGTLWGKPVVTVYVKPIRYTHEFLEQSDYFTVSFYPETFRRALALCGSLSGRDCDKVKRADLTPVFLEHGVTFEGAERTIVCKKLYTQSMELGAMPEEAVAQYYRDEPAHTMFIGEVERILRSGTK